ncbi:MAG: MBL fold metallo-hydrolase [Myxococcales bacterium]|nr:MBL fold metallo-hydrolase [Myxococcales bacterium]
MSRILGRILCGSILFSGALGVFSPGAGLADSAMHRVKDLKVTILSTMLADSRGLGEWGFAALVEADGFEVLYDTGYRPETVKGNAEALGIDLSSVKHVVLSHNHGDHTGGLLTLRRHLRGKHPDAMSELHAGAGLFAPRKFPEALAGMGFVFPPMAEVRQEYEALGGTVHLHGAPVEIGPGVWLTGPVPRRHPEKNWSPGVLVERDGKWQPDALDEDSALIVDTVGGLIVITGCGHAGIVNILDYAGELMPEREFRAVIGGLHLFSADDATLDWTADHMKRSRVRNVVGAHCTGLHAVYRLRDKLGLPRENVTVGAVGASFNLDSGIDPLRVAR